MADRPHRYDPPASPKRGKELVAPRVHARLRQRRPKRGRSRRSTGIWPANPARSHRSELFGHGTRRVYKPRRQQKDAAILPGRFEQAGRAGHAVSLSLDRNRRTNGRCSWRIRGCSGAVCCRRGADTTTVPAGRTPRLTPDQIGPNNNRRVAHRRSRPSTVCASLIQHAPVFFREDLFRMWRGFFRVLRSQTSVAAGRCPQAGGGASGRDLPVGARAKRLFSAFLSLFLIFFFFFSCFLTFIVWVFFWVC